MMQTQIYNFKKGKGTSPEGIFSVFIEKFQGKLYNLYENVPYA